ncbi:cytochrome P450 [Streptomyces clavuligerus]|uniref:Cytochrome P450 n=1 Tax=Streptomyces clavuligerus TaxID=1901 RepID=B5GN33_STRCL|nr:cytochrome P450 [Streptomyces clavuligerus]ANW22217.1 PdmW [Streptomyces clavuligerus]AXU17110.1 cytochrome P450 [Streptomyces clavuligerus]EDY47729.1 PdmW [Streptomyces clavuligerus]EFG04280.1 Cytochrome P450 [Streptomyces clavuligerus]MBY6307245.1 cytochrome P450 [Streptomyces clavuligerus]
MEHCPYRFPFPRVPATRPPAAYAEFRRDTPVVRVAMPSGDPTYLVTRYEDARMVLTDARFSRSLELAGLRRGDVGLADHLLLSTLANMDRPEHPRLRRLVAPAFSQETVERLRPRIERITDEHLTELIGRRPPVDLTEALCVRLPVAVLLEYLGVPLSGREELLRWTGILTDLSGHTQQEAEEARELLHHHLREVIAERRRDPGDNVFTDLARRCYEEERITELELEALAMFLLIGGLQTVVYQLGLIVVALLRSPAHAAELAAAERPEPAIEELLRYTNAVESSLLRITTEDVVVAGTTIPRGSAVLPAIPAANHDPERFGSPETLDFDRTATPHLTFGHGMHRCLGAPISRLMLNIAVPALFRRVPELRLAVAEDELSWLPDRLLTGYASIPVTWSPRPVPEGPGPEPVR